MGRPNTPLLDIGMGIGVLVAAIASVIAGETIFGSRLSRLLTGVILGSIVNRGLLALGLRLGLPVEDFKLMTAVLVLLVLCLPALKWKRKPAVLNAAGVLEGSPPLTNTPSQQPAGATTKRGADK